MGIFSKFEGKMEDTFEGAASKMFNAPISPVQIAKKAEKQMKRESTKMVGIGKQYAPTLYTVLVNAEDDSNLFGYYPTLAGETETYLAARAGELGLYMDGQPLVRFIVDEGLRHGKFDVIAETVAAPIIAQLRDEEMQRYGLADAQANVAGYGQQFSRQGATAPAQQAAAVAPIAATPAAAAPAAVPAAAVQQAAYQAPAYQAPAPSQNPNYAASTAVPAAGPVPAYNAAVTPVVTPPTVQGAESAPANAADYDLQYNDEQYDADYDADFGDSYDNDANFEAVPDFNNPFAAAGAATAIDSMSVNDAPDFSGFNAQGDSFDDIDMDVVTPAAVPAAAAAAPVAINAAAQAAAIPAAAPSYDNTVVFTSNQQDQYTTPNYQQSRGHLTDVATHRTYDLAGSHLVVGRESKNNIVVPDINVSRQHADLRWDPQGVWVLTDLGSTNGTFVNGSPISSQVLQDGDRITFGVTDFVFSR